MILLPLGHEETAVRRLPWISFGVIGLCVLAFFLLGEQLELRQAIGALGIFAGIWLAARPR